jgi:hypothetical protein
VEGSQEAAVNIKNGIIVLDSKDAKRLGFTSDRFGSGSYLWKMRDAVWISLITSSQKGNFQALVKRILSLGLAVKVPTPLARMEDICRRNGYVHSVEHADGMTVEVWTLKPPTL